MTSLAACQIVNFHTPHGLPLPPPAKWTFPLLLPPTLDLLTTIRMLTD